MLMLMLRLLAQVLRLIPVLAPPNTHTQTGAIPTTNDSSPTTHPASRGPAAAAAEENTPQRRRPLNGADTLLRSHCRGGGELVSSRRVRVYARTDGGRLRWRVGGSGSCRLVWDSFSSIQFEAPQFNSLVKRVKLVNRDKQVKLVKRVKRVG